MSTKTIRLFATLMIEIETDLNVDEAVQEFEQNTWYSFKDTENVKVLSSELKETSKVSYTEVNKTGTHILLKPLKNESNKPIELPGIHRY